MLGFFDGVSENKNFIVQEEAAGWPKASISLRNRTGQTRAVNIKTIRQRKPDRRIRMYLTQIQFVIFVIGQTGIMHLGRQFDAR